MKDFLKSISKFTISKLGRIEFCKGFPPKLNFTFAECLITK